MFWVSRVGGCHQPCDLQFHLSLFFVCETNIKCFECIGYLWQYFVPSFRRTVVGMLLINSFLILIAGSSVVFLALV